MSNIAALPLRLKELNLPTIYRHWEIKAKEAEDKQWSYPEYLNALSELEVNLRYQNRVARHIQESRLPRGKTLATFDFKAVKSINPAQITALADNPSWVRQAHNLIIFGPSGVGKTHLAAAIGYRLIEQDLRVFFTSTVELVQKLQKARTEYKLMDLIHKLDRIPMLILDDIGYVKKNEAETSVLFELIAHRYEAASLIITSNQPFGEWDQIFPDNMMAVAAIDRLIHHATIMHITDDSYRKIKNQICTA